jgi:hypothetical protein
MAPAVALQVTAESLTPETFEAKRMLWLVSTEAADGLI